MVPRSTVFPPAHVTVADENTRRLQTRGQHFQHFIAFVSAEELRCAALDDHIKWPSAEFCIQEIACQEFHLSAATSYRQHALRDVLCQPAQTQAGFANRASEDGTKKNWSAQKRPEDSGFRPASSVEFGRPR